MTGHALVQRRLPRSLVFLAWAGLALLLFIGISASALRATNPDLYAKMEPVRVAAWSSIGILEPNPQRRADAIARIDSKFAGHAIATLVHVVSGALLFILLPLQFSKFIRSRHRAIHRWSGRFLVVIALVTGLGGLFFGVLHPFAGIVERLLTALIGAWFLFSISVAFVRIRRGETATHREWMLRAVATALGISMMRVVGFPVDVVLTSFGTRPEIIFLHSLWLGCGLTVLGGEWWIRRTRPVRAHVA